MSLRPEKLDKRRSRIVGRLAADNRHFSRGKLTLKGRFLAENGWEYPLEVIDLSPGGMLVQSDYRPNEGQQIVMLLNELGRIQAKIVRTTETGFAVAIIATLRKRDQLADRLTWLMNAERLGLGDDRAAARTQRAGDVHIQLLDGTRFVASSIDVSISGMAVLSQEKVTVGEPVRVGKLSGIIARHLDGGFAIRFDPPAGKSEQTAQQAEETKKPKETEDTFKEAG